MTYVYGVRLDDVEIDTLYKAMYIIGQMMITDTDCNMIEEWGDLMLNFIFIILAIFLLYYKYHLLAGILIGFVVGNFIGFNLALLDVEHGIIVMKE